MNKNQLNQIIIYILLFVNFIIFLNLGQISDLLEEKYIYVYIVAGILMSITTLKENNFHIVKSTFFYILICFGLGFFCFFINGISLGNTIIVVGTIIYIFIFSKQRFGNSFYKILLLMFMILGLYQTHMASGSAKEYLTNKTYLNPNTIAQLLLYCLIYINFICEKFNYNKKILFFLNLIIFYGIYKSECRSVLVVGGIYVLILNFVNTKFLNNDKLIKISYIGTIAMGILVPIMISTMYTSGINIDISVFNKDLYSGREILWEIALNKFDSLRNILLGVSKSSYITEVYTLNFHNIFLTILINYGILLCLLYYCYLWINMKKKGLNVYVKWGIICILLTGIFENIIMTCTFSILFGLMYSFFDEKQEGKEIDNK